MKKNDKVIAKCIDYTYDGMGIVKVDGFCLFVKNLLKDEVAEIVVTKLQKDYGYGKVLKLIETSVERVQPKCSLFPQCGGCQLQHFSSKHQAEFKRNIVQQAISHIGKLDLVVNEVLSMDDPWKYRNKMQVPVQVDKDGKSVVGFYRTHSHVILPLTYCEIQSDIANKIVNTIQELLDTYGNAEYFRHLLLKTQEKTNEIMVVFVTKQRKVPYIQEMTDKIVELYPNVCSILQNVNGKDTNVILSDEEYVLSGRNYVVGKLQEFSFQIASRSFFQINPMQTELLYETAIRLAEIDNTCKVADVYCGVGTISMFLAKYAKEVVGIEIVPQAIENAKENARNNGITNVSFMCGDAKHCTVQLAKQNYKMDVAVVDPPRKGCDTTTLDSLIEMSPKRIVYVSCNPSTLARDLRYLEDRNYKTQVVQPVDMFPQTYHVENVAVLVKE